MATRVTIYTVNGPGVAITFQTPLEDCITAMEANFADPSPIFRWDDAAKSTSYLLNKSQIFDVEFRTIP